MLAAILLLTLVSAAVELYLCHKVPLLGKVCKSSPLTGLAFSIILSVMLGKAFGATGMITLVAGLTSTLITGVVYKIQSWMDVRKTPAYAIAKQRRASAKARLANIKQLNKPKRTPAHQHKPSAKMVMAC